jgi:hypothetical protein
MTLGLAYFHKGNNFSHYKFNFAYNDNKLFFICQCKNSS